MSSDDLSGKTVLLIAARFFGYEKAIATELRRRGAIVDLLADRPFDTPIMKAVTRFMPSLVMKPAEKLYHKQLGAYGRSQYDIILIVNGQTVSSAMLNSIKHDFPGAKYILYMWDSFQNRAGALANLGFFDRCLTFDPDCAKRYGLIARPLFFSPGFSTELPTDFAYAISFIGTMHTDRFAVLSQIDAQLAPETKRFWYLYLQAPWVFHVYRLTNRSFSGAKIEQFAFEALAKQKVQEVFSQSRSILDIEHPRQTGLTIRTLETVGASRKLITTNSRVSEYDFYNPSNICVIDRERPKLPERFLETEYEPVPPTIYSRYSISGWMDEVLGG
ncbi:MAG TPA: hypothetical protein VFT72_10310 [Opitutaceae bacterium]|nr:hypothetical protein [Opitutaceae bacterium]